MTLKQLIILNYYVGNTIVIINNMLAFIAKLFNKTLYGSFA
jgi:hypothetical protein